MSAILQDAIAPVCDLAYDPAARGFAMAVSRFRWERTGAASADAPPVYEWINSIVQIGGVQTVQTRQLNLHDKAGIYELLALILEDGHMVLIFSGGAQLRLRLDDNWSVRLEDFGAPWPTAHCPRHDSQSGAG